MLRRAGRFAQSGLFGGICGRARNRGPVSLFADSVDFLEDASINSPKIALSCSGPALFSDGVGRVFRRFPVLQRCGPPGTTSGCRCRRLPVAVTLAGTGALAVNLTCAMSTGTLSRPCRELSGISVCAQRRVRQYRDHRGGSNRRDAFGLARPGGRVVIAAINADAAREVYVAARQPAAPRSKKPSRSSLGSERAEARPPSPVLRARHQPVRGAPSGRPPD